MAKTSTLSAAQRTSLRRAKSNCKKFIDAGNWKYFFSLTFSEVQARSNYWIVAAHMTHLSRWLRHHNIQYVYVIGTGNHGATYHVHLLVSDFPSELLSQIPQDTVAASKYIDVYDAECECYMADNFFEKYGVGLHLIQRIESNYHDYDRLANYVVGHFFVMKEVMGPYRNRLYFHSNNSGTGNSYKCVLKGSNLSAKLFANGKNKAALVISDRLILVLGQMLMGVHYTEYIDRYGDRMYRFCADWQTLFSVIRPLCAIWLPKIGWV